MSSQQELDKLLHPFINELYGIRDCLEALETIIEKAQSHPDIHKNVFRECYKRFYIFGEELRKRIVKLLYRRTSQSPEVFSFQDDIEKILAEVEKTAIAKKLHNGWDLLGALSPTYITQPNSAIFEYKKKLGALKEIQELVLKLEKHVKDFHFQKTDISLLLRPDEFPKTQEILNLFESPVKISNG